MRVLIAEDDALLRQGLVLLLETEGIEVVGAVGDVEGFPELVGERRPDAVVVDVRLPPGFRDEGLRAAAEVRRRRPGFPVLVLSAHVEGGYVADLLGDDARGIGYLLKDRVGDVEEFVDALRRVAAGGTALDPEVVAQLFSRSEPDDPLATLTCREREVLALMAEGHDNQRICVLLELSAAAVSKHIGNIFTKLGLPPAGPGHRRVLAVLAFLRS
ncbi:response regulator [Marinitenerispora sediminis]|uniref:DNA-binding response regulator n=1 Tax=Marinitenerispora sediminis TaxID=1931232 RepID=A0A368T8A0_9ACTN|nr:response regulator transcription factor [Marinitenerispora sediminis]RCV51203.1 DNA-binding response regulator [Marinitenerispora sediminis]RCV56447.1 DNA-binding response regulator [Marinitenerispora sediminis]RCV60160.1 DNA-binding response regulator [Marinitenerispora sediminis]